MSPRAGFLASLLLVSLASCAAEMGDAVEGDLDEIEAVAPWTVRTDGLHLGEHRFGSVDVGARDAWPVWVSGSTTRPVLLRFRVSGFDGAPVRIAVLGPVVNGARATLASAGYNAPVATASVNVSVATTGQLLVVVGSYQLASFAGYDLSLACKTGATSDQCSGWRVDTLSLPKLGALSGSILAGGAQRVTARLNGGLAALGTYQVELWRSPPAFHWLATRLAVASSVGSDVTFNLPAGTIAEGDDLFVRVRAGTRLPYADRGVWSRFAPNQRAFARLDVIDYHDLGDVAIEGVGAYFEGRDLLVLSRTADGVEVDRQSALAGLPGQASNGLASFSIIIGEPFDDDGNPRPVLPHDGDILALDRVDLNETSHRLGCFEYCNDLAGTGTCTARAVACP
jgi:hypothetical protein